MGMPRQKKEKPYYKVKLIGVHVLSQVCSLQVISHDYWTLLFQVNNKDAQFPCPSSALFLQLFQKAHTFPQHLSSCLVKLQLDLSLDINSFFKHHPTLLSPPKKLNGFIIFTMILNSVIHKLNL